MKYYHEQTKTRKFRSLTEWLEHKYHKWLQRRVIAHYEWEEHKKEAYVIWAESQQRPTHQAGEMESA